MGAQISNLYVDQGSTYSTTMVLTDINGIASNLANMSANGQIRKSYTSANVVAQFATIIDVANGVLNISLPSDVTANMSYGRYVYDILLSGNNNIKMRLVQGILEVSPSVTR